MSKKHYINRVGQGVRETVSECDTRKEAEEEYWEYSLSDNSGKYYISNRCCSNWKD